MQKWEYLIYFKSLFGLYLIGQNTLILRAIPGLNELGRALLGNENVHFHVYCLGCIVLCK